MPKVPLISTFPAALGEVLALALAPAASADPLGEVVADALPPLLRLGEPEPDCEEDEIRAGPLDVDEVELEDELALMLELELELELALADGWAARLALPPPIVETGVHCEVAPAGWGAGVVGSPCRKVDPP